MNHRRRLGVYLLVMLALLQRRADGTACLGDPAADASRPGDLRADGDAGS